jgi:hypothetical protein
MERVHRTAAAPLVALTAALAACSGSTSSRTHAPSPSARSGCVSKTEATQIWTDLDKKLTALELDPSHANVGAVATGQAQQLINEYLQMQLVTPGFTEREVDKLEKLSIVAAGCGGGPLMLQVTELVAQDDYLKPNGQVDHADPLVGKTIDVAETFVRSGGGWKESNFADLNQGGATPTPQIF